METVSFTQMKDGTRKEYELLARLEKPFLQLTADRVLSELRRAGEVRRTPRRRDCGYCRLPPRRPEFRSFRHQPLGLLGARSGGLTVAPQTVAPQTVAPQTVAFQTVAPQRPC